MRQADINAYLAITEGERRCRALHYERGVLAAALSAHRSAAFDVHVLAGSGCGAAEVAGSGFAVVVAGEEAGERADEVE